MRLQAAFGPQRNLQALNLLFERGTQRCSHRRRVTKDGGFNFDAPEWMVETLGQLGFAQPHRRWPTTVWFRVRVGCATKPA